MAKLLLKEDVDALGRKGEIVTVKPGYARNFLLPQGLALIADANALRMQERLKEERKKQAVVDLKESEILAEKMKGIVLTTNVKVDQEGHMYGSVTAHDLMKQLEQEHGIILGKRDIQLKHPIKTLGSHTIEVKLKEGVKTEFGVTIHAEGVVEQIPFSQEASA